MSERDGQKRKKNLICKTINADVNRSNLFVEHVPYEGGKRIPRYKFLTDVVGGMAITNEWSFILHSRPKLIKANDHNKITTIKTTFKDLESKIEQHLFSFEESTMKGEHFIGKRILRGH